MNQTSGSRLVLPNAVLGPNVACRSMAVRGCCSVDAQHVVCILFTCSAASKGAMLLRDVWVLLKDAWVVNQYWDAWQCWGKLPHDIVQKDSLLGWLSLNVVGSTSIQWSCHRFT